MTSIIGVDFSGSQSNDPWVTEAELQGNLLRLMSCYPLRRELLTERLRTKCSDSNAVIGMDFPFGLPRSFVEVEFGFKGALMTEMWEVIQNEDLPEYIKKIRPRLRKNGDLQGFNKCLRQGDKNHFASVAYSPLNPAAPEMFAMTFYGMSMLHTLWTQSDCRVPPLDYADREGAVLLETMPGVLLRYLCLPAANYKRKNKTNGGDPEKVREEILNGLKTDSPVLLQIPEDTRDKCLMNDDCLDSLVAAIAAAIWAQNPDCFRHPSPEELPDAQLEGWIYAPKPD